MTNFEQAFDPNQVDEIIKKSIQDTIEQSVYDQSKVGDWNSGIIDKCMKQLVSLEKRFKYVGIIRINNSHLYYNGTMRIWIKRCAFMLLG